MVLVPGTVSWPEGVDLKALNCHILYCLTQDAKKYLPTQLMSKFPCKQIKADYYPGPLPLCSMCFDAFQRSSLSLFYGHQMAISSGSTLGFLGSGQGVLD